MKNLLRATALILCLTSSCHSFAQTKADSIFNSLSTLADTAQVGKLIKFSLEFDQRDFDLSRALAEKALKIATDVNFKKGEADAAIALSVVNVRQGQFAQALALAQRAEGIQAAIKNNAGLAEAYNAEGMVYNQQGQYPAALEQFSKALKLRRELNQPEIAAKLVENIGIIHFRQQDYQTALQYFKECYQSYQDLGNEAAASKILVNLGATYNKLNMRQEALQAHGQSLEFFKKTNSLMGMGIAYNNIGSVYFMLGDYPKAIENYTQSLELKRKMNDRRGIAVSLSNIAEAYIMLNNLPKARQNIDESLKVAQEIKSKEQIKVAYEMLSKIAEKGRDFENALIYERKMSQARDSLFSADKTEQISRMRAIYETEKAEREARLSKLESDIELGRKESQRNFFIVAAASFLLLALMVFYLYRQKQKSNELLSDKNILIEKSLKERETLLKEIHHRVKNNLQIISSLLSLQSKSLHDSDAQGAINESRNRVKSMSLIHEQLYQEDTISGVEMKDYITRLSNSLALSYGLDTERVQLKIQSDDILLDVDSAIPLGLIINELVTNSMKYAFPNGKSGSISIGLKETGKELHLSVTDNGIGMDAASKNDQSFGLSMVNSLSRKLKAEVNTRSSEGTAVELVVRDYKKAVVNGKS